MEQKTLEIELKEVTSSSDCPTDHLAGASSVSQGFSSSDINGVHTTSNDLVHEQGYDQDRVTENHSSMLSHESFMGSRVSSDPHRPTDENDIEDQDSTISELSGLSDLSNVSEDCKPTSDSASWVQKQRNIGIDPRLILGEILPQGSFIPHNINEGLLWRYIINVLNEPRRSKLNDINTLDDAVNLLRTCKKIIILTGAGVSVSCGIPDFRSRDGIYARLSKDYPDLPDPQAMFDISYFRRDPRPFFKFAKEIYPGLFQPSSSHRFIKLLEKQGKLLRNYTQNIDTLEHAAGIQNVITCHGSFATATCTLCRYKVDSSVIKEDIFKQTIPYCPVCPAELGSRGIMKPDIVFFGEGLSDEFHECMSNDKSICDLLIVIGSSLKVRPVATIPSSIPMNVPQILINREPLKHLTFDIELLGDCDVIIGELCRRLQSEWPVEDIHIPPLKEICVPPTRQNFQPVNDFASLDSSDFGEINNNYDGSQGHTNGGPSNFSQSEESNSCDYRGLSAIKLDDSEDGSNQEQVLVDSSTKQEKDSKTQEMYSSHVWPSSSKDISTKKLPENSYLFIPPNRYIFQGAEVQKDDDEDCCCSTSTDYSSDSDSPQRAPLDEGTEDTCSGISSQNHSTSPRSGCDQSCIVSENVDDLKLSKDSPNT